MTLSSFSWDIFLTSSIGLYRRLMGGWSQHGVSQMEHLLAYKRNGGDLLVLLRKQAEEKEVVFGFSSSEMISWERKHGKKMGKYVEALQGSVNLKGRARLWLDLTTL